jgi:hypothetical protein
MVWDRNRNGAAKIGNVPAVDLTELEAELLEAMLNEAPADSEAGHARKH